MCTIVFLAIADVALFVVVAAAVKLGGCEGQTCGQGQNLLA